MGQISCQLVIDERCFDLVTQTYYYTVKVTNKIDELHYKFKFKGIFLTIYGDKRSIFQWKSA